MLVGKQPVIRKSKDIRVGESVKILTLGRIGSVIGHRNGMWQIKLDEGTVVSCIEKDLEVRHLLMENQLG
jgi:hypothetical protein